MAVFALLNTLNAYWFVKLVQIAAAGLGKKARKATAQTAGAGKRTMGIAEATATAAAGKSPKTAAPLNAVAAHKSGAHDGHAAREEGASFVIAAKRGEVRAYATDSLKLE